MIVHSRTTRRCSIQHRRRRRLSARERVDHALGLAGIDV